MPSPKEWLKSYYFAVKFSYASLFLLILFLKDVYAVSDTVKYFFTFLALLYLAVNIYYYLYGKSIHTNVALRILDYISIIPLVVLAKNLYGLLPASLIFICYGNLYWKEVLFAALVSVGLLIFNLSFLRYFQLEDFVISVFYFISVAIAATKLNLVSAFIRSQDKLNELRENIRRLQKEVGTLSRELRIYKETFKILDDLYVRERDSLDKTLERLLGAEKVYLIPSWFSKRLPFDESEGFIRLPYKKFVIFIKPKEKYLEKDPRYRRKLDLLVKVLKPYIESFLANKR